MTYEEIKNNEAINTYIRCADESLTALGYTEHSFAHVTVVAETAGYILETLGYDPHVVELGKIAGYMHDLGNLVNRIDHSQSGAVMAFRILDKLQMPPKDIATIVTAIGNHDEGSASPVTPSAAALIIADKSDVRRTRVRGENGQPFVPSSENLAADIHDRVNYAVESSELMFTNDNKELILSLKIDLKISSVMEYFEIFLSRMSVCRTAAHSLGVTFGVVINNSRIL